MTVAGSMEYSSSSTSSHSNGHSMHGPHRQPSAYPAADHESQWGRQDHSQSSSASITYNHTPPFADGHAGMQSQYYPLQPSQNAMFQNTLAHSHSQSSMSSAHSPLRELRHDDRTNGGPTPVLPTWFGFVEFSEDALKLVEACLIGKLTRIQRRPDENERPRIIQHGAVFVFDETSTGILRWTDDRNWSPSRVRGNFMLYRELEGGVLPGEKKKAIKRSKNGSSEPSPASKNNNGDRSRREDESSILGSHTESYPYKKVGGLIKRTFSAWCDSIKWSVISYYDPDEVEKGSLRKVCDDTLLKNLVPRSAIKAKLVSQSQTSPPTPTVEQMANGHYSYPPSHAQSYGPSHQHPGSSYPTGPMLTMGHAQQPPPHMGQYHPSHNMTSYAPTSSYDSHFTPPHSSTFPAPQPHYTTHSASSYSLQPSAPNGISSASHYMPSQHAPPMMDGHGYGHHSNNSSRRVSPTRSHYIKSEYQPYPSKVPRSSYHDPQQQPSAGHYAPNPFQTQRIHFDPHRQSPISSMQPRQSNGHRDMDGHPDHNFSNGWYQDQKPYLPPLHAPPN